MVANLRVDQLLYTLREPATVPHQFRSALEEIGYILGTRMCEWLDTDMRSVVTELGTTAEHYELVEPPVLICLLRAGLPLYMGVQRAFPEAPAGFIGTMRDEQTLESKIGYVAVPKVTDRDVILIDTMLATGGSMLGTADCIRKDRPARLLGISVMASEYGYTRVLRNGIELLSAAVDPELTPQGFIVPGLGDAGDRCFGKKDG